MTKRTDQWWHMLMAVCATALSFAAAGRLPADWPFVATMLVMALVVFATLGAGELILRAARARR